MNISITSRGRPRIEDRVSAACAGDRSAFDELVNQYRGPLRQFLTKRVPFARLDDLSQDVWLAAWSAIGNFDRRSSFQTWLFAIALNKIRDLYRRDRRSLVEVPLLEHAQGFVSPEVKIEAETTDVVRSIVSNLPEKQREVVVLYYCCEYTLPEIAKITGRNLNTIKYQFYAAHADLAQLAKEGKLG